MAPSLRLRTWLCVSVLLVPALGCVRQRAARSPRHVVEAFGQALAKQRVEAAYERLSSVQRATLSSADFRKELEDNATETKALSNACERIVGVRIEATVELADGRQLRLTQEGDTFYIDQAVSGFYPHQTPREALLTFVRAIEAERWDVLLALMPSADRGDLSAAQLAERIVPQREEVTRIAALLSVQLEAPIEIVGDRATMPYGEGATMRFVRESDGWKVEDPE